MYASIFTGRYLESLTTNLNRTIFIEYDKENLREWDNNKACKGT